MFLGARGSMVEGDLAHRHGEALRHVVAHGVDGRVVAVDGREQVVVQPLVRRGRVDVAAPDPPRGAVLAQRDVVAHGQRLRIVDHDEVVGARELGGVGATDALVELPRRGREVHGMALQAVVEALRHVVELGRRRDHLPLGREAGVGGERHQGVEDLRHAAAEDGGVDVKDALSAEIGGQLVDLGHELPGDDGAVVRQGLVPDVDLVHGTSVTAGRRCPPGVAVTVRPRRRSRRAVPLVHHNGGVG